MVQYDNRRLLVWSHSLVSNVVRHRYLQNTADLKVTEALLCTKAQRDLH